MACGDQDGVDGIAAGAREVIASSRPSDLVWPMIGSMAFRRLSSRLIVGEVMPRVWAMMTLAFPPCLCPL